ncbi:MAG: hypothetical protein MZU91_00620 [Desulfosudis oleivorans]|nr:hypothetical protein [Desulfosudis oleivorans]
MRRRKLTVFSLSFIDCICCGLGAIILLFVVVNSQNSAQRQRVTEELTAETDRWEQAVLEGRRHLVEVRNSLDEITADLVKTEGLSRKILQPLSEKRLELADRDQRTLAGREHVNKLKADIRSLEEDVKRLQAGAKREEELGRSLRPFPGQGDRQYLTGLKMGGQRILILVDASASMLDDTVVGVIRRRNMGSAESCAPPSGGRRWRPSTGSPPTSRRPAASRSIVFNETAGPLLEDGAWLEAGDINRLNQAVDKLRRLPPEKGTSLINAFEAAARMSPPPDNLFLLTDGLPTLGKDKPWGSRVSADERLSLFREAVEAAAGGASGQHDSLSHGGGPHGRRRVLAPGRRHAGFLHVPVKGLAVRKKDRDIEVFSLSFLDCICCGFGAMILLFVLSKFSAPQQIEAARSRFEGPHRAARAGALRDPGRDGDPQPRPHRQARTALAGKETTGTAAGRPVATSRAGLPPPRGMPRSRTSSKGSSREPSSS